MAKDLTKTHFEGTADIKFHSGPFMIPASMTPRQALKALSRLIDSQEEITEFSQEYTCLPQDGAAALNRVLTKLYGWSAGVPTPGFFGQNPPEMMTIDVDHDKSIQVPWGRLDLPNINGGYIETSIYRSSGGIFNFRAVACVEKRHQSFIQERIFDAINKELEEASLYKGKCFTIEFSDSNGREIKIPDIKFVDLSKFDMDKLILSEETERNMQLAVWAPIRHHDQFRKQYGNIKRGVLMEGTYGTGKTLSVSNTAKLGKEHGFTVVYCKKTTEFEKALRVCRNYQNPCGLLIVEDIDIELAAGRSDALNQIINTLDGLETKSDNIITLMTTNDIEAIEPAAIRQGRVSAKIQFTYPDVGAVQKLIRVNAGKKLAADADITAVGEIMQGMNPAEIEESVTIANMAHLHSTGKPAKSLSVDDLVQSAKYMRSQADIQRRIEKLHVKDETVTIEGLIDKVVSQREDDLIERIDEVVGNHV